MMLRLTAAYTVAEQLTPVLIDFSSSSVNSPSAEDLTAESVLKEDKTIKSKGSGPDFTKLADEISTAFKKIFSGSK